MHQRHSYRVLLVTALLLVFFLWNLGSQQSTKSPSAHPPAKSSSPQAKAPPTPVSQAETLPAHTKQIGDSDRAPHVVVVGAGISGITTALELGLGGARVTVLDMSSVYGGHAVMSQGGLCIVNSPLQQSLGLKDSPDLAYDDFITWGEDADEDWGRYYVDHSRQQIYEWLVE